MRQVVWGPSRPMLGAALALAASGCSAGSGEGTSSVETSFQLLSNAGSISDDGSALEISVQLNTTFGELLQPARVDLRDIGSGTATAGQDYLAFETQTLEFPAGTESGAVQTISLTSVADGSMEGAPETVYLELVPQGGDGIDGSPVFQVNLLDADQATIGFVQASQDTAGEGAASYTAAVALTLTPGSTLDVDVSMLIIDAGASATAGEDYSAFGPQLMTFPAGSSSGSQQMVTVTVLDDAVAEGPETIMLQLQSTGSGAILGSNTSHGLVIVDDDGAPAGLFTAQMGPSGTEQGLAYNAAIDLGSQVVDAGPNGGTRVRITNQGTGPMVLGAPVLSGTNTQDFDVEIEILSGASGPAFSELGVGARLETAAPLIQLASDNRPGIAAALDQARVAELGDAQTARLHGFPLPDLGEVTLDLARVPLPIEPGAVLMVDGQPQPGGLAAAVEDISIWSGSVLEVPGARAFLSFGSDGPSGFVELPYNTGRIIHILPEASETQAIAGCRVVHEEDLLAAGTGTTPTICGGQVLPPNVAPQVMSSNTGPSTSNLTVANCRLAIETDYQLYAKFGSVSGLTSYVTGLIGAISDQYMLDVQTSISISYLGVYSDANDPWTNQDSGGSTGGLLSEFRSAWNANGWPASADLAHFLSGANLGGGIAYLNVLCNSSFGYGVSANLNGNINWGTWDGEPASFTWDFVVVAHELGHNFGSDHTHEFCPPLDVCYDNCSSPNTCSQGTIMSYCHSCGGMDNIDLRFHHVTANVMRSRVEASCLSDSRLSAGDYVQYLVRFNPIGATGSRSATLEFAHDALNETQPFELQLTGDAQ